MIEPVNVAINGAGRIGLLAYRALQPYEKNGLVRVVLFNDADKNTNALSVSNKLERDDIHGKFPARIHHNNGSVYVDDNEIQVLNERVPSKLAWGDRGVDIVLESTGAFTKADGANGGYLDHIKAGAKYVVISAPVEDDKAKTVVIKVNYDPNLNQETLEILGGFQAISNASCTTYCLAPVVDVLHRKFGVIAGDMSTVHSYTNDQKLLPGYHKDPRRGRSANNIIPTSTGASKAIGKIFPDLAGKISENAISYRIPFPNGSIIEFNVKLMENVSTEEINEEFKRASESRLEGILQFETAPLVVSDIIGNAHSSIVDSLLTQEASEGRRKIVAWYDNEWGYSNRTAELIVSIARYIKQCKS